MINHQQKFIAALRQAAHRARRAVASATARDKATAARLSAQTELFRDTLRQEGIDPDSADGVMATTAYLIGLNTRGKPQEGIDADLDAFDKQKGTGW
ncbi:MAG TPA: hypothetical protein VGL74_01250 [Terriglobales bacterium]|jgi:hypothetical protein